MRVFQARQCRATTAKTHLALQRLGAALGALCERDLGDEGFEPPLPIGSGVIEAACKTLATQRMKRSGMRWRHDGGQAILTLRALMQSHRFDHAWNLLSETYRAEVTLPANVVALPRKRAA